MKNIRNLWLCATGLLALSSQASGKNKEGLPNILFILCDDLGYGDVGCYGQKHIQTPHIDRMAREGMRFTQAYAGSPVSAPSRASLMTGQHSGHGHVRGNKEYWPNAPMVKYGDNEDYAVVGQEPYDPAHIILPEIMKKNGYATGLFGKWAGGYEGSCSTPEKRGIDEFYGLICQFQAHLHYPNFLNSYSASRGDKEVGRVVLEENIRHPMFGDGYRKRTQYAADLIHRKALEWIDAQSGDRPFCGFLTYTLPHAELVQPEDSILQHYRKQFFEDKTWGGIEGSRYNAAEHTHAEFAGMVTRLDAYVGEVLAKLKEKGLDENTLVVFTSDNGPHEEGGADPAFFGRDDKLRGLKRECHEGGIRVPFIVRWPGKVPAGQVNDHQLAFYDVMPTFCELLGDKRFPKKYLNRQLPDDCFDGVSFLPTLTGNDAEQRAHEFLYWEFHETDQIAVRMGKWKMIVKKGKVHLYDLEKNIHEDNDVSVFHPDIVRRMKEIIRKEHRPNELFRVTLPADEKVLFTDDFNGPAAIPDTTVWELCTYANNAWAQHFKHVEGYENVKVENGYLKLKADKTGGVYKNGGINTKFGFPCNSRLEVKARLKPVRGGFPAIWQMPVGGLPWPRSGEVDVMEWVQGTPSQIYQTVHTFYINGMNGSAGVTNTKPDRNFDVTQDHVYAVDRTEKAVIFYVDGKETWRYENHFLNKDKMQYPFCELPFNIILNYSLGGLLNGKTTWAGRIHDEDLPGEMWIDWVRVISLEDPKQSEKKEEYYVKHVAFPQSATIEQKVDMAARLVPTPWQYAWQQMELTAFLHFGINTFTGREWGDGKESPSLFNPTGLDTEQWVRILKEAGFKMAILTAKHHDGFCLWPTATTRHSVASSPWKNGKGDVVRELRKACEKYGLKFGVYLSPWDRNAECYGSPAYNEYFIRQLTELLTDYGTVHEVWFDGANGEGSNGKKQIYDWDAYYKTIKKLQPKAVIAVMGDDVRWVGNEKGLGRETEWSSTALTPGIYTRSDRNNNALGINGMSKDLGSREILEKATEAFWYPSEVDVSIRPGWFYHAEEDSKVKSLKQLVDIYYQSVGRNSVLLLNIPPDRRGLIHEADARRLEEFADFREQAFADDRIKNGGQYWNMTQGEEKIYSLEEGSEINTILLQEDITRGQRVEAFTVEVLAAGEWKEVWKGTTIGYKRLLPMPTVKAEKVRIKVKECRLSANICKVGAYMVPAAEEEVGAAVRNNVPPAAWKVVATSPLTIDLGQNVILEKFTYTPKGAESKVSLAFKYRLLVSMNGKDWKLSANGEFSNIMNNPIPQTLKFEHAKKARFIRLEAITVDGAPAEVSPEEISVWDKK